MEISILVLLAIVVFSLITVLSTVFVVHQQTVVLIERFGRYKHMKTPGIHVRAPFGIDCIAARVNLRIMQQDISIEQKTKDNVFVSLAIAVQYRVNEQHVADSHYKLQRPIEQIRAYVEDAIRSSLPKYTLDESYEKKEEIAHDVFETVSEEMGEYGYIIVKTLITSIEPDVMVKESMNEINAAQRKRVAAQELANADKIKIVTNAEADAEKERLHGVGIAEQRKAVVDGLAASFSELKDTGLTEKEVMSILLTNQYLDTMNQFANSASNNAVFLPANPDGIENVREQILSALFASKNTSRTK